MIRRLIDRLPSSLCVHFALWSIIYWFVWIALMHLLGAELWT